VNIAARIADRAPAGHVLVSETVREAADGLRASVRRARPLVIAGAKPVPLFRVEAAR